MASAPRVSLDLPAALAFRVANMTTADVDLTTGAGRPGWAPQLCRIHDTTGSGAEAHVVTQEGVTLIYTLGPDETDYIRVPVATSLDESGAVELIAYFWGNEGQNRR
jgi:hypothetical protein